MLLSSLFCTIPEFVIPALQPGEYTSPPPDVAQWNGTGGGDQPEAAVATKIAEGTRVECLFKDTEEPCDKGEWYVGTAISQNEDGSWKIRFDDGDEDNDGDEDVILGGAPPRDGQGLLTQRECNALADAMESLIKEPPDTLWMGKPLWKIIFETPPAWDIFNDGVHDLVRSVRPFIAFLRRCGGFRIY